MELTRVVCIQVSILDSELISWIRTPTKLSSPKFQESISEWENLKQNLPKSVLQLCSDDVIQAQIAKLGNTLKNTL